MNYILILLLCLNVVVMFSNCYCYYVVMNRVLDYEMLKKNFDHDYWGERDFLDISS